MGQITAFFYDDGNWNWSYECKYCVSTKNTGDWYYYIAFETDERVYLSDNDISCFYWKAYNKLNIRSKGKHFEYKNIKNFQDVKNKITPFIENNNAIIHTLYKRSIKQLRKEKLRKIYEKIS